MSSDLFGQDGQTAHARHDDPLTSHRAAAAITPGLPALQAYVEQFALRFPNGFCDPDLLVARPDKQASTLRTRRSELTARNIILDSGQRVIPEGHTQQHTIWIHRSFVPAAPPILEPAAPADTADREEARSTAAQMDQWARQMRSEGRAAFADGLAQAADLMRRLAR